MTLTATALNQPTPEDVAVENLTPESVAARRKFCDWLAYWRDCAAPPCRRAHSCMGDPTECFARHYRRYSEPARVWVMGGLDALDEGASARAAARAADAALVRHVKLAAGLPRHERNRRRPAQA